MAGGDETPRVREKQDVSKNEILKEAADTKRHLQLPTKNISRKRKRDYFPWSKLSGELRNVIYTYALTHDEPIRITRILNPWKEPECMVQNKELPIINLFCINKATYTEAIPLFYQLNTFHFSGTQTLDLFMKAFPEKLMPHLRHLIISTEHNDISPDEAFLPLIKATNLTCVELDRWMPGGPPFGRLGARQRMAVGFYGPPPPSPPLLLQQPLDSRLPFAAPSPDEGPRHAQPQPDFPLQLLPSRPQPAGAWPVHHTGPTLRGPARSTPIYLNSVLLRKWPLDRIVLYVCEVGGFQRWMEAVGDAKGDPRAGANVFCFSQNLVDKRLEYSARCMTPSITTDEPSEFRTLLGDMLANLPPNLDELG